MTRTLAALEGTEYEVEVARQSDREYVVRVFRPYRTGEVEMFHSVLGHLPDEDRGLEEVGARYLLPHASIKDLNRVVDDIISADSPSLVGRYTAEKENA